MNSEGDIVTTVVTEDALAAYIDDLAQLRITVFREFPYLYDGSIDYERRYLNTYIEAPNAMAVVARDGAEVIGASTGVPMTSETDGFKAPFVREGYDPAAVFYCGESVLLPAYRGRGVYRTFFREREAFARTLGGFTHICFCAVVRAVDDPRQPPGYVPLDAVWRHFDYAPAPGLVGSYRWRDVGDEGESDHAMQFWLKALD